MISELFDKYQLITIITPTISIEVPYLNNNIKYRGENNNQLVNEIMKYVFLSNFLGLPAYSVPIGYLPSQFNTSLLLPIGIQLIGNHWKDHEVN